MIKHSENTISNQNNNIELLIKFQFNENILNFIKKHCNLNTNKTIVTSTTTIFNIEKINNLELFNIINIKKINDIRFINKFFESVNRKLPVSGLFFGCVETYPDRKKAILNKKNLKLINWIIYFFDILFKRVFSKLVFTKRIYFYFTKGKGRVLSKAETYGRLYSCGFEIVDEKSINKVLYFVFKKVKDPAYDKTPTYGALIGLKRLGKGGTIINVYKLRTMHPYSEYLQEYMYNKNKLNDGGKIKNDFRISPEGRIFRKFWIDEIPMILNLLKMDIKLVGVRPLSQHFFSLYDKDLQELRFKVKPGFIPPFYVDLPKTMDEIMESERKYLNSYLKNPIKTDIKYLFISLKNVFIKGARSN